MAGEITYHCHGDQFEGGQQDKVRAVLARQWEHHLWALQGHTHGATGPCRLLCQDLASHCMCTSSVSIMLTDYITTAC